MDVTANRRRVVGQQRRNRTRDRLLVAAAQVLAERGEQRATIDDFIRAAGVARGTFYNYYRTKSGLLEDLWGDVGREPFQAVERACAHLRDPAERVGLPIRLLLTYASSHAAWAWLIYASTLDAAIMTRNAMQFPKPDLMLGRAAGRFSFGDLEGASDFIVGGMRQAINTVLRGGGGPGYADNLCTLLLRGLGVPDTDVQAIVGIPLPTNLTDSIVFERT